MRIKVVSPVTIRELDSDGYLELPSGSRVRDVLKMLKLNPARLLPVSVYGVQVKRSHRLREGDILVIIYPLGGG